MGLRNNANNRKYLNNNTYNNHLSRIGNVFNAANNTVGAPEANIVRPRNMPMVAVNNRNYSRRNRGPMINVGNGTFMPVNNYYRNQERQRRERYGYRNYNAYLPGFDGGKRRTRRNSTRRNRNRRNTRRNY